MWRPVLLDERGSHNRPGLLCYRSVATGNALSLSKAPLEHALVHRVEARVVHAAERDDEQAQDAQAAFISRRLRSGDQNLCVHMVPSSLSMLS